MSLKNSVKPLRIITDLSFAHCSQPFAGIPKETRLIFACLSTSKVVNLTGMLASSHSSWLGRPLKDNLEEQSVFLGYLLNHRLDQNNLIEKIIRLISIRAAHIYRRAIRQYKTHHALVPLLPSLEKDIIWRTFFHSTVPPELKSSVMNSHFVITTLGNSRVMDGTLGRLPRAKLSTQGFDIILFHNWRAVQVSRNTQKIIRFHDGLPTLASDMIIDELLTREHIRSTQQNTLDSIFVCDSISAQEELSRISPKGAEQSRVIPCLVPEMSHVNTSRNNLLSITQLRISSNTVIHVKQKETIDLWFKTNNATGIPRYIMSLATIEPRKNYLGLLSAWRQLRFSMGIDIKLIIVGSPGWLYKPVLQAMQPFVQIGELLHLEKVAQEELPYLYSAAECFAFLSFGEGFGLPPCEAMQCGCPVVLSDIPAHRYSAGNAALYCDPYDTADIAAKLKLLLLDQNKEARRQDMIAKGYTNIERFTASAVLPQWEQLFEEVVVGRNSK